MAQVTGITDLGVFWVLGQPNLNIKVDRAKAARYGLNVSDINSLIQAALGGATGDDPVGSRSPIQRRGAAAPEYRNSLDAIRNIKVGVPDRRTATPTFR